MCVKAGMEDKVVKLTDHTGQKDGDACVVALCEDVDVLGKALPPRCDILLF